MACRRLAEVSGRYLRRSSAALVEGRFQMREWTTWRGEAQQRLGIRADSVHFLEKPAGEATLSGAASPERKDEKGSA